MEMYNGKTLKFRIIRSNFYCKITLFFIQDDGQCPGAFHVGCDSDPTTPSSSTTTTSTPTPNDANHW